MATPQSTTSHDGAEQKKFDEQITFRFCSECSNMLYPKEDEESHKLQFTCRTCQYTEDAASTCVFRNVLNSSSGETAGVTQDVGSDPTVSEFPPVTCLCCGIIIYCNTCEEPCDTIIVNQHEDELDSMGLCQFNLPYPYGDADPFSEYDEELMEDCASDNMTLSDTSEAFCYDGAMVIEL